MFVSNFPSRSICLPLASLAVAGLAMSASGAVLVDFGSSNTSGVIGGNHFNAWNPGNNIDLIETDGVTDSGWNLASTTPAVTNNGSSPDFVFNYNGAPTPFADDSIVSDALNLQPGVVRNVRFFNLDALTEYEVVIYAGRDSSQTRVTTYTLVAEAGGTVLDSGTLQTSGVGSGTGSTYNNDDLLTLKGTTDSDGELFLQYEATTGDFGYLNALQFNVVPEPASMVLVGLGGFCLASGRRRAR
ncbi:MAG: PEP-CTERM sorting domain-containing protein [Planctomycetota bacterium]